MAIKTYLDCNLQRWELDTEHREYLLIPEWGLLVSNFIFSYTRNWSRYWTFHGINTYGKCTACWYDMNLFDKKKVPYYLSCFMFASITLKERHNVPMLRNMITDRLHLWQLYGTIMSAWGMERERIFADLSYKNVGHQCSHIFHILYNWNIISAPYYFNYRNRMMFAENVNEQNFLNYTVEVSAICKWNID